MMVLHLVSLMVPLACNAVQRRRYVMVLTHKHV
jgi:hypothetical protein